MSFGILIQQYFPLFSSIHVSLKFTLHIQDNKNKRKEQVSSHVILCYDNK